LRIARSTSFDAPREYRRAMSVSSDSANLLRAAARYQWRRIAEAYEYIERDQDFLRKDS